MHKNEMKTIKPNAFFAFSKKQRTSTTVEKKQRF